MALAKWIASYLCARGYVILARDMYACAIRIEPKPVISTFDFVSQAKASRQGCTAVTAAILKRSGYTGLRA
jgi:hypothetical protein